MSKKFISRTRNWATVLYPESAADNWKYILDDLHIEILISPLHDSDINADGEIKKSHYHIIFMFPSVKSKEQFKEITDLIKSVGQEPISSIRGYARYLCHLDNPDKFNYSVDGVIALGGCDYQEIISLVSDKYQALRDMFIFIDENNVKYFDEFLKYCSINNEGWFRFLTDNCGWIIKEYIKSSTYRKNQEKLESLGIELNKRDLP